LEEIAWIAAADIERNRGRSTDLMTDYVLKISSYAGLVAGARHYRGRVEGPHPKSCHGGTVFHGSTGKTTCAEGHEIPKQVTWDVEEPWTEERYQRYAAEHFEGDGPSQFLTKRRVVEVAVLRFAGSAQRRWFEEEPVVGEAGDRLFYHWEPWQVLPESFTDEERAHRDELPLPGDLLAEIPAG
jgi:hypothetical protein